MDSVVRVVRDADGAGFSAVVLGPRRLLTAAHCVGEGAVTVTEFRRGSRGEVLETRKLAGRFGASDAAHDLAAVELSEDLQWAVPATLGETPRVGDEVTAVGCPNRHDPLPVWGRVWGIGQGVSRVEPDHKYLGASATVTYGSSGGGLFDRQGRLVGVTSRVELDVNGSPVEFLAFFVLPEDIAAFLKGEVK
jgi:S1-C subfamily serine protease